MNKGQIYKYSQWISRVLRIWQNQMTNEDRNYGEKAYYEWREEIFEMNQIGHQLNFKKKKIRNQREKLKPSKIQVVALV